MFGNKTLMIVLAVIALFFAYWYNPFSSNKQIGKAPIVETEFGKLIGSIATSRTGKEYYEYLGVPYALPPTGERRFEPPQPPAKWEGIKTATSYGSKCLQLEMLTEKLSGNEDCLFLNVFVPKNKNGNDLPVMVFIHGGAFVTGSSDVYGATHFMDEQVILVTLNYRLAGLGFLNTGDSVVRGNMGLKDQLMALSWVKQNIKTFCGDTNRITLFGESAGAASVHFHILSPRSQGKVYFRKLLLKVVPPLSHWSIRKNPKQQAQRFAAKFSCPVTDSKEMVACLKKVDGAKFVSEHREMLVPLRESITVFVPTIETYQDENTFLGEEPLVLLKEGRFNKVPLISGLNSEEGLLTSAVITANQTKMDQANDNWTWWVSKILDIPEDDKNAKLIRKFYFGDKKNIASISSIRLYYYTHKGDFCLGNIMASSQGRFPLVVNVVFDMVSRWFWQTVMKEAIPHMGTAHADELPFLFDFILGSGIKPGNKDFELSASMIKLWVSFATNDDSQPIKYNNLVWLPSNVKEPTFTYLQIDTHAKLIDEPFKGRVEFWDSLQLNG